MNNKKFYTGIGSRDTPDEYLDIMTNLAHQLDKQNWILRSGGSWGADEAFQKGTNDFSNIFIPTKNFRKGEGIKGFFIDDTELIRNAMYIVSKYNLHEHWDHLINSKGGLTSLRLHTRNVFQILGKDLRSPSKFVVCYTKDKACKLEQITEKTGGSRTAMRLACHFNINLFNIAIPEHKLRITNWIEEMKLKEKTKNNTIQKSIIKNKVKI